MLHLPVIRWGQPYESLESADIEHFHTGEPMARVSQANGGIVQRDLKKPGRHEPPCARYPPGKLIAMCQEAAERFTDDTLPMGDGQQYAG